MPIWNEFCIYYNKKYSYRFSLPRFLSTFHYKSFSIYLSRFVVMCAVIRLLYQNNIFKITEHKKHTYNQSYTHTPFVAVSFWCICTITYRHMLWMFYFALLVLFMMKYTRTKTFSLLFGTFYLFFTQFVISYCFYFYLVLLPIYTLEKTRLIK